MLNIFTMFCKKYLIGFQRYEADTKSILKFTNGHNSLINESAELQYLFSLQNLIMLYIYLVLYSLQVSEKYLKEFQYYGADMVSILRLTKGIIP